MAPSDRDAAPSLSVPQEQLMSAVETRNQYANQDPTKQYPKPKFEEQTQSAPGLAQAMTPKPDHGEKSYRGFGRLAGRKALITGADSVSVAPPRLLSLEKAPTLF
jgi:hypothetical protein